MKNLFNLNLSILVSLLLMLCIVPGGKLVVCFLMIVHGIRKVENALFAMFLLVVVRSLNLGFFGQTLPGGVAWLVLFIISISIIFNVIKNNRLIIDRIVTLNTAFCIFLINQAGMYSLYPSVSIFKIISYGIISNSIYIGCVSLTDKSNLESYFVTTWYVVTIFSGLTILTPGVAYYTDGMGFQGIMGHPQFFAVYMAVFFAWIFGGGAVSVRNKILTRLVLIIAVYTVFSSRGRTAFVSIAVGGLLVLILIFFWGKYNLHAIQEHFAKRIYLYLFATIFLIIGLNIYGNYLYEAISSFVFKDIEGISIEESFESSRGFLIHESIENFKNNYINGIGFGVSYSEYYPFNPVYDEYFGLPLGASTEKPNLALAILEETGILGGLFFGFFATTLSHKIIRSKNVKSILMYLVAMATNISEMTFFSMGGLGLYIWLTIGYCSAVDSEKIEFRG